ncbi:MAG: hypothetical protein D6705_09755 [Deltaproteobacteria bacterium]|nr:MAG: hypothetical protein D6705_09755 [Deltaproteobacteria bacterium]
MASHRRLGAAAVAAGVLAGLLGSVGCSSRSEPASGRVEETTEAATAATGPATASAKAPTATASAEARLLAWLDPDATTAAAVDLGRHLDLALIAYLAGAPPQVEDLVRKVADAPSDLAELVALDVPDAKLRWEGLALASLGPLDGTPILVAAIGGGKDAFAATLAAAGFSRDVREGFEVLEPRGAFPHRIVLLDDGHVAFVSRRSIGSGLSPLSAARDLPASPLERRMLDAMEARPRPVVEIAAAGPLPHLDAPDPLAGFHATVTPWQEGGLDVRAELMPTGDPESLAAALSNRKTPGMDERTAALARQVAFTVEGNVVRARLQIPATTVRDLLERPR